MSKEFSRPAYVFIFPEDMSEKEQQAVWQRYEQDVGNLQMVVVTNDIIDTYIDSDITYVGTTPTIGKGYTLNSIVSMMVSAFGESKSVGDSRGQYMHLLTSRGLRDERFGELYTREQLREIVFASYPVYTDDTLPDTDKVFVRTTPEGSELISWVYRHPVFDDVVVPSATWMPNIVKAQERLFPKGVLEIYGDLLGKSKEAIEKAQGEEYQALLEIVANHYSSDFRGLPSRRPRSSIENKAIKQQIKRLASGFYRYVRASDTFERLTKADILQIPREQKLLGLYYLKCDTLTRRIRSPRAPRPTEY